jgi:hypothetical protein
MKYALLIYVDGEPDRGGELDPRIAAVLERPSVADWARLQGVEAATTLRRQEGRTLVTDGPFVDSKEFLAGLIIVDTADLDGALAIAEELQDLRPRVTIEVRPLIGAG